MRETIKYLQKNRVPAKVVGEVAEFIDTVSQLAGRLGIVAGGVVGLETVLEHHGLITPEVMEAVKVRMTAKMTQVPEQQPEQAPEQAPEQKPE